MKKDIKSELEMPEIAKDSPEIKESRVESLKERNARKLEEMRIRDRKKVRGKFIFHEVPGGVLPFNFNAYKGDPIERFELMDGEIYTLPLGVARHLNTNCAYPIHEYITTTEQNSIQGLLVDPITGVQQNTRIGRKVRRCSFQSLEFTEMADMPSESNIVTVERI